jgi:23S rRNA pseudouridine1911/1915/1917 synthase
MPQWRERVEASAGRLDRWLQGRLEGYSLRQVRELIRSGRVRLRGRPARKGTALRQGMLVTIADFEGGSPRVRPEASMKLEVVFEDASLAVVDKPAGMPCHPLNPEETGTLLNGALARWPEMAPVGSRPLELGLIHRLDTKTSGLVLLAKTEAGRRFLSAEMKTGKILKIYRAVVQGRVREDRGEITLPLGHHPKDKRKMVPALPGQRIRGQPHEAITRFRVLKRGREKTLLELELVTGVTHQVRVHLAAIGHPVIGDDLYGSAADPGSERYWLQAWRIEFQHPVQRTLLRFEAPKPLTLPT